jgi:hypothetical protein
MKIAFKGATTLVFDQFVLYAVFHQTGDMGRSEPSHREKPLRPVSEISDVRYFKLYQSDYANSGRTT